MSVPRGAWTLLRRMWESPKLIPVLSVMTVVALAGAAFAVFGVLAQDDARERDRVASDLSGCLRGNRRAEDIKAIGAAGEQLLQGIVDIVLPPGDSDPSRAARIAVIRDEMEPLFEQHRVAVAAVEITDCERAVPGAKTTTTTEAP